MVVLNLLGKIEPICISERLKLYIANLPKGNENNWNEYLVEEMQTAQGISKIISAKYEAKHGKTIFSSAKKILKSKYPDIPSDNMTDLECIQYIADEMICLYFDYNYDDMPVGDWTSNCFDGRICEGDYAVKIISLIDFVCSSEVHALYPQIPCLAPHHIYYSDEYTDTDNYHHIFGGTTNISESVNALVEFGKLIDGFLIKDEDYYFLDYLCTELYRIDSDNFTPNSCQKLYSLCEFFLEKDNDRELDGKLPQFITGDYSQAEKAFIAKNARQIRNKIAHGDFSKFGEKIEEYATVIMDGKFWFDYSEYSRQNWAITNLCLNLLRAIQNLTARVLTDREYINKLKCSK